MPTSVHVTVNVPTCCGCTCGEARAPEIFHSGPVTYRTPIPRSTPVTPFQILDDQQTTLRLPPGAVDPAGNPLGNWAAPPTWAVDDATVVAITPAADGLSCLATTTGKLGSANVTYTGTVGGASLTNTFAFTVVADTGQPVAPPIAADPPVSRLQPAAGGQPAAAGT